VTERPEAVKAGTVQIVGTAADQVYCWTRRLLDDRELYLKMANAVNPYGDGRGARRTVEGIRYHFGLRPERPDEFQPRSNGAPLDASSLRTRTLSHEPLSTHARD